MVCMPQSVAPLGPFWPRSNDTKRGQGGKPPALKARWVPNHKWTHLSQFWPPISTLPKIPQTTPGPKLAKNHVLTIFNPWPLAATRGHQLNSSKLSSPFRGKTLLHQCTLY
ncbi:hypothetical protein O181_017897 [Austropuccinia psidii MF-1]|uniref:Uncharacterized protein n=1 Tax=Austropuccinia psidii MF-1 TaxID=1389203 RepID=A0A9Q3GT01_9BASI|nr:hypothetical protein [Austropuccinia psidii MF-1]